MSIRSKAKASLNVIEPKDYLAPEPKTTKQKPDAIEVTKYRDNCHLACELSFLFKMLLLEEKRVTTSTNRLRNFIGSALGYTPKKKTDKQKEDGAPDLGFRRKATRALMHYTAKYKHVVENGRKLSESQREARPEGITEQRERLIEDEVMHDMPYILAAEKRCKRYKDAMISAAEQLPQEILDWVETIPSLTLYCVAVMLGGSKNPSHFPTVAKWWKWWGYATDNDGFRQGTVDPTWDQKAKNKKLQADGPVRQRKSIIFGRVTCSMLKVSGSKYKNIYDARKEYEVPRVPNSTKDEKKQYKRTVHLRAVRYANKRFLRDFIDLWWKVCGQLPETTRSGDPDIAVCPMCNPG